MWHAGVVLNEHRSRTRSQTSVLTPAFAENDSIGWSPAWDEWSPDPRFVLLLTGTLPAGIVSGSIRPEAGWQTRHRLWDPVWLLIHEAVAIPFWFWIGAWLDTGRSRLTRTMQAYLAGRIGLAVLAIAVAGSWWTVQFVFWLGLGGYGALQTWHWLGRTVRRAY